MKKLVLSLLPLLMVLGAPARAEVVEEIVAWVNGDVITIADYREEEQAALAEAYRRYSGDELDQQIERLRKELLLRLIDRKILVDSAQRLYDMKKMGDVFLTGFKQQQEIGSDAELKELLDQENMTLDELKTKLVEMYAPEEVMRFEVTSRVFVSEDEIKSFYEKNADKLFQVFAEVTLREIVVRADDTAKKEARRAEATKARERIAAGEDFGEVAREVSEAGTRDEGGRFGPLKFAELSELLREPARSLPVGAVSEIIEAPYGFHIIRVEERTEDHLRPLDEIRDQVRQYLQERKALTETEAFLAKTRNDSEWCVKPKFEGLLSIPARTSCQPE